jgi:hypothetical protein
MKYRRTTRKGIVKNYQDEMSFEGRDSGSEGEMKLETGCSGEKKGQTEHHTATTAYPCYLPVLGEFSRS